jgi:hypothetical protein
MAIDTTSPRSRRTLLAATVGGLAGLVVHGLGRPETVRAGSDGDVVLGDVNTSTTTTSITNTDNSSTTLSLENDQGGLSLRAFSPGSDAASVGSQTGSGLVASNRSSDHPAMAGLSWVISSPGQTGVLGYSGPQPAPSTPTRTGVYGVAPAGRGGQFSGGVAQLRLVPSSATSHPVKGQLGDLFLDKTGRLWFCKGGASWKQIA